MADNLYIGIMSGTSVDAIDAALVDFGDTDNEPCKVELIAKHSLPFDSAMRERITQLFTPNNNEIDQLGELSQELGALYAHCTNKLLQNAKINPHDVTAIGCHGQTIRHRPRADHPFTLQIGDTATLAQQTGISTVSQFRQADIARGGQGAPLTPGFHHAVFHSHQEQRCIVNIGGISNITWLPAKGDVLGWDTGPGNGLMDAWIQQHQGKAYDVNGEWAASGTLNTQLLEHLLAHPYFATSHPKSTGKEDFTPAWINSLVNNVAAEDVQRTLLEVTAISISQEINKLGSETTAICGGGAYNRFLMERLTALSSGAVVSTQALGIDPQWVEAIAFAWLARQFWLRKPGNMPSAGATQPAILGQLHLP